MIKRKLITLSAAAALLACAAAPCAAQKRGRQEVRSVHETTKGDGEVTRGNSQLTWIEQNDGIKIEFKVEGKIEMNEDYTDVASIPTDGRLTVEDNRSGVMRRYRVERGAGGGLQRVYSVEGRERALDAEGHEWLRRVMLQAVRQGGLFARERAQKILRARGARGLSEELAHVRGDYVRRIYFEALVASGDLDEAALADALRSLRIGSDYERAQFLIKAADVSLGREKLVPVYFEAVGKIESDYEHRRVLSAIVKRPNLSRDALVAAIRSSAGVESDYEKATFLIQVARLSPDDGRVRAAFADAARTIGSDYERGRVETCS
ncbi:MAG: hypothetical protein LC800_17035 [Acidobacteria bacterium]|nr:hypothetical protein [Acidobacteriota bacterium]